MIHYFGGIVMEREKIKPSLFYLMLCLIILLCLSNKVIAKENTPNSYNNIPTDCYLKVTPRKKKSCVNTIFYAADYCQEDNKSYNKKERMKKTAKKNFQNYNKDAKGKRYLKCYSLYCSRNGNCYDNKNIDKRL